MSALITILIICALALPTCAVIALVERIDVTKHTWMQRARALLVGGDNA